MSLAMFAAPFNDNNDNLINDNNNNNNIIDKKKQLHNKTQKKYLKENFDTNRVKTVLDKIHNNLDEDDDDNDKFNPPPKAESSGVQRTIPQKQESMIDMTSNDELLFRTLGRNPQPNYEGDNDLDLNNYSNYGDDKTNEEYYKRTLPAYNSKHNKIKDPVNNPYYNRVNYNIQEPSSPDILIQKLNYMITLLEEQQDEKTSNVTEEVVLYSFLGIFIIFIADTFVRAGKYVR